MTTESVAQLAQAVILPPDGGWGWVIVFSSFFCNLLVDGLIYSVGAAFQEEWENYFDISSAATSLAFSILAGTYQCVGPVAGVLVNMFGAQKVVMTGSILAFGGFLLSMFAKSIVIIYLTFGLLAGIGLGLVYMPAIVMVGHYFQRKRALATGIAMCGSGIGFFVVAPLATELNREYNWRNALLILSAIALNLLIFGSLFREIEPSDTMLRILEQKEKEREGFEGLLGNEKSKQNAQLAEFHPSIIRINGGHLTDGPGSVEYVSHRTGLPVPEKESLCSLEGSPLKHDRIAELQFGAHDTPHNLQPIHADQDHETNYDHHEGVTIQRKLDGSAGHSSSKHRVHRHSRMFSEQYEHDRFSRLSLNRVDLCGGSVSAAVSRDIIHLNRPLSRNDVFYNCSVQRLREFQKEIATSDPNLSIYIASITNLDNIVEEADSTGHVHVRQGFVKTLCSLLDVAIFKSPCFLILFTVSFIYMLGGLAPFIFLPRHAVACGHSERAASFLVSIVGVANIVFRVLTGFVADHPKVDALWISTSTYFLAGLSTLAIPYMRAYWLLASYAFVFGAAIACCGTLRSVITAEMLGLDRLNNAYGLSLMACGIGSLLGAPMAGWLRDITGSLTWSFYLSGAFMTLSGVIQLPLRRVNNWEFVDDESTNDAGTSSTSA